MRRAASAAWHIFPPPRRHDQEAARGSGRGPCRQRVAKSIVEKFVGTMKPHRGRASRKTRPRFLRASPLPAEIEDPGALILRDLAGAIRRCPVDDDDLRKGPRPREAAGETGLRVPDGAERLSSGLRLHCRHRVIGPGGALSGLCACAEHAGERTWPHHTGNFGYFLLFFNSLNRIGICTTTQG